MFSLKKAAPILDAAPCGAPGRQADSAADCGSRPSSTAWVFDEDNYSSTDDWRLPTLYSESRSQDGEGAAEQELTETWRFYGDFYHDDEDVNVYRSVACQQLVPLSGGYLDLATTLPQSFLEGDLPCPFAKWPGQAPSLSSLWPFEVSATHVTLQHTPPSQAWRRCVDAIQQHGDVSIVKLRPQKYAVKAEFSSSGSSCEFKVFIFSTDMVVEGPKATSQQGAVIEFQRRSGDSLAFNQIFKHMRRILTEGSVDSLDEKRQWRASEEMTTAPPKPKQIKENYSSCGSSWLEFHRSIPCLLLPEDAFQPLPVMAR